MGMIVGFTGTRQGMTEHQREQIHELLRTGGVSEAHHGDCVGADADFHELCVGLGIFVVIHPPINPKQRAYCKLASHRRGSTELPREYLQRNRDIVAQSDLLIGCPSESEEPAPQRGQGTWSTIRWARRFGHDVRVVWP